ncbi:MAG: GNAT family N-acetyltransferase, partial [Clostridia bacterium]|nr:GNAT family N-acetyltransferase [Clostridia bacterium]
MRIISASELPEEIADRVYEIERVCFSDAWSARSFRGEREVGRLFVAMEEDVLLGYIVFWRIEDECEIANIATHPDHRGRGVGSALLARALECG